MIIFSRLTIFGLIALNDNVDTANKDTSAMDMMPIVNLFNEWHSASTSKKIRTVIEANAKAGKYRTTFAPYGYVKGTDEKKLPVVDEPAASVVRRIFEMRSQGISPRHIADILNTENIPTPADYFSNKHNKNISKNKSNKRGAFLCKNGKPTKDTHPNFRL